MGLMISPAEPPLIRSLGTTSAVPERHGFDILWPEKAVGGLVGIQRKELNDLLASMRDGRLAKELAQLKATTTVKMAFLVVEGKPHWSPDGMLIHKYAQLSRVQYNSLLRSVQSRSVMVEFTDNLVDTANRVLEIEAWCAKPDHSSLDRRPKPGIDSWGSLGTRGFATHLLQSVPGIGPKHAQAIYDHFDGKVPIGLTVHPDELLKVKGLGAKRIAAIVRAFGSAVPAAGET